MSSSPAERTRNWRKWVDLTQSASIIALAISLFSFYRSYVYVNQQLEVTVTEVSYGTNRGELYMTVAFSNAGNRDAAVLRVEPALWASRWIPVSDPIDPSIPFAYPRVPLVVKAGGVEVITLSTLLPADVAERAAATSREGAFLGVRVATMNSDGNLYKLEHPVAKLTLDANGHILGADPAIHRSLSGFTDLDEPPPGDRITQNKQTPFVWAEQDYR